MADDKVRELAGEVASEFAKGWRESPHFELLFRLRLKPLLDAAQEALKDNWTKELAAELRNWRKE